MRKKALFTALIIGAFLVFGLGGTALAENPVLKIGFCGPLSGGGMSWGYGSLAGLELAMEDYNQQGGLKVGDKTYTLKSIPYDTKYLPDPAVTAAKRLIFEDKVKIIYGEVGSAAELAMQSITEPNKIIVFGDTYTPRVLGPDKPFTFRWLVTNVEYVGEMLKYYHATWPQAKRLAYFYPDDETGQTMFEWEKKEGLKYGLEVVGFPWERGTPDMTPIITKALASKIGIMDLNGSPPGDAGQMVNILRDMGWDGPIVRSGGAVVYDLIRICGAKANGVIYHEDGDFAIPACAKLVERFKAKKYPAAPNTMLIPSYDGARLMLQAIQKVGTVEDTEAIVKGMESIKTFNGVQGKAHWGGKETYGIDHQLLQPIFIGKIVDQKPSIIEKVEF